MLRPYRWGDPAPKSAMSETGAHLAQCAECVDNGPEHEGAQ